MEQFVALPRKEKGAQLQREEILIYVCIRRYMNKDTMEAFPAMQTIATKSGCSKATIRKVIKSICDKGYMTIEPNKGRGNIYKFGNEKYFEPFSYAFLDKEDLTWTERLVFLCEQQYMFKDENTHQGKLSLSYTELAQLTGLNRQTISRAHKSLEEKGYMVSTQLTTKDPITGLCGKEYVYFLDKIDQAIVFAIRNLDERTTENTENIKSLQKDNEILMRELAALKTELAALKKKQEEFSF